MYRRNRAFLTVFLSLALVNISLFSIIPEKVKAPEQFKTYPSSVTVTSGTPTGSVPDDVSFEDGKFYTVVEEDVNPDRNFQNDTLNPNGVGTFTQWAGFVCPACTDNYEAVDEGPPFPGDENTTYIFDSSITGDIDTYATDDYTLQSGWSIDEVVVHGAVMVVAPPDGSYAVSLHSGSTTQNGSFILATQIWTECTNTWTTDPDTSLAWTDSGIDAMEIGNARDFALGLSVMRATLVWATVQSSEPLFDYTAVFQFDFTSIKGSEDPELEIKGLRTGDSEAIMVQVLRSGVWITLSSDAFETTLTTLKVGLSTTDVLGGSASVRVIDSDITDDTQTTISIDEIVILTGGKATNPSGAITVQTRSEYRSFENRLLVNLFWSQSGGPEEASAIDKWVTVFIDGHLVGKGIFRVKEDHTFVPVPWNVLDPGMHNGTVRGFVLINWTTGPSVHSSLPEEITLDNFLRWLIIVSLFMLILIITVAWGISKWNQSRIEKEMLGR